MHRKRTAGWHHRLGAGGLACGGAGGRRHERTAGPHRRRQDPQRRPLRQYADQITQNIAGAQLLTAGATRCGTKVTKPVWQFHVVVPKNRNPSGDSKIDGFLAIDAATGKLVCAGLPFLD